MKNRLLGIFILFIIIAVALTIYFFKMSKPAATTTTLKGYIGGEKEGLFEDNDFKNILSNKYGLAIDYSKTGSIDMVKKETTSDFLFPSSQIDLEIFQKTQGDKIVKSEAVFNSPLVIFSWDIVTDALVKEKIVRKEGDVYYISDFPKLINMTNKGKKWSDIGLGQLYGNVKIISTDPKRSNSGNMFCSLVASILNEGMVIDNTSINKVMPTLKQFNSKLGYMENSSSRLFDAFLSKGVGENPMIVGYENQLIEFAVENPDQWKNVKGNIRILYPEPTVWSSHQLIITDSKANNLSKALLDKDVQKLAWEKHGFRSSIPGIVHDTKIFQLVGVPKKIDKIISLPKADVVDKIVNALE